MSQDLVYYSSARQALQQAASVDEVKDISDKAAALALYAKQHKDIAFYNWATEIKARAARRIGELSKALEQTPPKVSGAMARKGRPSTGTTSKRATLTAAGLSKSAAQRCEVIASLPEAQFEGLIAQALGGAGTVTLSRLLVLAFVIAVVVFTLCVITLQWSECAAMGGHYVRGVFWFECLP